MAYNILIVDDSAIVRAVIKKALTISGVDMGELFNAPDGKIALEIVESEWVDLVLADINMPVMGGIEMVKKMSEDGLLATIPVIIVSTEGSSTRIDELKAQGVSAYIRKPFTPEQIREAVDEVMGEKNGS
ncbi:MAG: response regulator [Candidatus Marinimicrobia bacterium]|nr:response regulator [Candidatus Neomarinimicrobiota bacterium]